MSLFYQLIKFGLVGGLGTLTNLLVFFVISDMLGLSPLVSSIIAFMIAVTQNFILNNNWTFQARVNNRKEYFQNYIKFVLVCISGLVINLVVLKIIIHFWLDIPFYTIAQALGIMVGTAINFIGSKFVVYSKT